MDGNCGDSISADKNKGNKDDDADVSVFKTTSPVLSKPLNRCKRYESTSEDDFIASQIARSAKRKSSSFKKKDDYDFLIPYDPVSSPLGNATHDKIPEIHTIGSLLKSDGGRNKYQEAKNVYETLGMDKDVSWDSTMASPAPKMPKEELNTIERQTLLPADGFRNIQPRALFSPGSLGDEGGIELLRHSSDSELSDGNSYETRMRLSDVCETLKDLKVKSLENKSELTNRSESPVLKKPRLSHKKRGKIVDSPVSLKIEKEQTSWIPDDSFQNSSFSCIDEISKNSIDEDQTLIPQNVTKIFYETNLDEIEGPVKSLEEILKPVQALEDADIGCSHKNINNLNFKKGLISFSNIVNEENKIPVKRGRCEISGGENREKKKLRSEWDLQDDTLNSQLCKTLDDLEKEESKNLTQEKSMKIDPGNTDFKGFSMASGKKLANPADLLKKAENFFAEELNFNMEDDTEFASANEEKSDGKNFEIPEFGSGFKKASGSKIKINETRLSKAKMSFNDLNIEAENFQIPEYGSGFKKASGSEIKINQTALSKAKTSFEDLNSESENFPPETFELGSGFKKASGSKIKINEKLLSKAKMSFKDLNAESENFEIPEFGSGFKKASGSEIKIKEKLLSKAKVSFDDFTTKIQFENSNEETRKSPILKNENSGGFKTATGKNIEISSAAIEKAKNNFESVKSVPDNKNEEEIFLLEQEEEVPPWVHVYQTDPSEGTKILQSYVNKSPVLTSRDRFMKKKSQVKKLDFEKDVEKLKPACQNRDWSFDFSITAKKSDGNSLSEAVMGGRKTARMEQKKLGEKGKIKPRVGIFLKKKLENPQVSFSKIVNGAPGNYSEDELREFGIRNEIASVNIENALGFKFNGADYFGSSSFQNTCGIPIGDDCFLILNDENQAGVEEFTDAFFASPGVEPSLITKEWVSNHYKWIVWKLAHYETSFPEECGGKSLTPENVMLQLKYRYDREIDRSERSALKKILEGDDTSVKRLVLCVFSIKKVQSTNHPEEFSNFKCYQLGLTDGWYSCNAHTDPAMIQFIENGKITIGSKLVTCGAELVNGGQGISPLEVTDDVYLKISTNSTRRIRWDAKLGFQKNPGPIPISLGSILAQGGIISRVDVIVVRVYPILYVEKKRDGTRVTRNRRAEDKAASAFQQEQEAKIEKIYSELQAEYQNSKKSKPNVNNLGAEDLCEFLESCSDPSALQLSTEQENSLADYRQRYNDNRSKELSVKLREKLETEKINKRDVSELLKVKIIDMREPDYKKCGLLSLWKPTDDVVTLFQEGKAVSLTNLSAGNYNRNYRNVRLSTTKYTQYSEIPRQIQYPSRSLTRLCNINPNFEPCFDEIDIVGMVVYIQEIASGSKLSQTVYLTDTGADFVGIVFWGSCRDLGWENVLTVRSVVAASNLQWMKNCHSKNIPSIYVNENTIFTENPKQNHLQIGVEHVKKIFNDNIQEFVKACQEKISLKLDESINKDFSNSSIEDASFNKSRNANGFGSNPNASSTPIKSKLSYLDASEQEPSPIAKKIEKLKCYGEPPPISPLPLLRKTFNKKFKSKFKVPSKQNDSTPAES